MRQVLNSHLVLLSLCFLTKFTICQLPETAYIYVKAFNHGTFHVALHYRIRLEIRTEEKGSGTLKHMY